MQAETTRQRGLQIGYLPQDGLRLAGRTLFDECLSVFDEAIALEKEQEDLARKMSELDPDSAEYGAVTDRFQWVIDRYQALDGYTKEAQVGTVLDGLAFPKHDWERPIEEFSGGWQMRIALAKLLLEKPNCCCSTSRRTTLISKHGTGWKSTSGVTLTRFWWSRTTVIFSM